ncbi:arylsulfatase B-like [Ptychodera flava]|uniref:arylsulfatase B-like n=1 Tax=Ptychodera flava TaxID=63121 RepID=UPI003969C0BB
MKMKFVIVFAVLLLAAVFARPGKKKPHIIFLLADNSGWSDVEWNDPIGVMKTPNLKKLASTGVILNQTYAQPICTPTRAALMTGYYPFRSGLGHAMIMPSQPSYLSREFKVLPEHLKELGYTNHLVGKWHLGACRWDVTPLWRGFDSHYGPHHGYIEYYTQSISVEDQESELLGQDPGATALDFHDNTGAMFHHQGTHASELTGKRAVDIISRHNSDTPMFLWMTFLLPHFPFMVPDRYRDLYSPVPVDGLQEYRGMVSMLDETVGNITNALIANDMYENSVIVYLSDNGGPWFFGTQWPLRGGMATPFEGGVRSPGMVHSPLLEKTGYVNNELIHVVDFFPTFLSLAGGTPDPKLDGKNVWNTISTGAPSPRTDMLLHFDTHPVSPCTAIRYGDYKLIHGRYDVMRNVTDIVDQTPTDTWFPPPELSDADIPDVHAPKDGTQLFDLSVDPLEINNLADEMPDKVAELLALADVITAGAPDPFYPDLMPDIADPNAWYNGTWTPGWC